MKIGISLLFTLFIGLSVTFNPLEPCPKSPNCVCTLEKSKGFMQPIPLRGSLKNSKIIVKTIMATLNDVKVIAEFEDHIHYEVVTQTGKFTDDIEFYWDTKAKLIHFRSASQKGWYDFGANKRRMKRLIKRINALSK